MDPLPLDTLFDLSGLISANPYPRRLAQMHLVYGQHPTAHCRDCAMAEWNKNGGDKQ